MKNSNIILLLLFIVLLPCSSCDVIKNIDETVQSGKTPKGSSYIELKDGTIYKGNKIIYPQQPEFDPFKKIQGREDWDTWIGIDDRKIDKILIYGYQDNGEYRTFFNQIWITRLKKGKLNLYFYETDATSFGNGLMLQPNFVYEKNRGDFKMIYTNMENFYTALEDVPAAASLCKSLFPYLNLGNPNIAKDKLLAVTDAYNK